MRLDSKTPLAERIRGVTPPRLRLPRAMELCDTDFFRTVGRLTEQEDVYQSIYERHIWLYGSRGDAMKRVWDLVLAADSLEDWAKHDLLFWVLIDPFITIQETERRNKT